VIRTPNPLPLIWRLARARPWVLLGSIVSWTVVHALPALAGPLYKALFDALSGGAAAIGSPMTLLVLLLALEASRIGMFFAAIHVWVDMWGEAVTRIRRNLLARLLTAPGAPKLPDSPSEAVSRYRDDVDDVGEYLEIWVDLWGFAVFAIAALLIMARIDPLLTLIILAPLAVTLLATSLLRPMIRRVRRALREATGRVTDFIGEATAAVTAIQGSGREASVVRAFARLGDVRRRAAVRDALLLEAFRSANDNLANVATGLILLAAAGAMQRGSFTVGDFALFVAYLPRLAYMVSDLGAVAVRHRRAGVAFERLGALIADQDARRIVAGPPLGALEAPLPEGPTVEPLQELAIESLCVRHADGEVAVEGAAFVVPRGAFVVVTGRVGSGKSALVKGILGLLPVTAGTIRWNGRIVADPATFFVPPRSAYVGQVPQLFSDTLRENVLQGADPTALPKALHQAVLDEDVARLERGLDTPVGSRGVKLSGGQVQRAAAARAFVRAADLLVFDDLSSALDAETEATLWRRLATTRPGTTIIAVSHRPAALTRADLTIAMEGGRIASISGRLAPPRSSGR
jgi:ATP-binding cassette, subfamily B, bacterial